MSAGASMRTIVHATDFSGVSTRAFHTACALAQQERARLLVLHVLTPPSPFVNGKPPSSWVELEARAHAAAERRLETLVARAKRARVDAQGRLVRGTPARSIVWCAKRARANLIVIGTHGRSGLGRWFMGSVAARILQIAECPVLTVRRGSRGR